MHPCTHFCMLFSALFPIYKQCFNWCISTLHSLRVQNASSTHKEYKIETGILSWTCKLFVRAYWPHGPHTVYQGWGRGGIGYLWTAYPKRSNPQRPKRPSATTRTLDTEVAGTSPVWSNSRLQVQCIERISPSGSFCPSYEHGRSECKPSPTNTSQVTKPHPTCGEKRSCGCSGQENRTQSVLEWLVMLKVRERPSLM